MENETEIFIEFNDSYIWIAKRMTIVKKLMISSGMGDNELIRDLIINLALATKTDPVIIFKTIGDTANKHYKNKSKKNNIFKKFFKKGDKN